MSIDLWLNQHIPLIQTLSLNKIMTWITFIGSVYILLPLSLLLVLSLFYKKRWRKASVSILSLFFAFISGEFLKIIINRTRPLNALLSETDPSFPSGHTLMSTVFFLLILYSYKNDIKSKPMRSLLVTICALFPLLIGFSRLYLNVHWLTDVLTGYILGFFWVILFIYINKKMQTSENKHPRYTTIR